jgi:hypothetical protein
LALDVFKNGGENKMKKTKVVAYLGPIVVLMFVPFFKGISMQAEQEDVSSQKTADMLYAVLKSDRIVYSKYVFDRLITEDKVIKASEHWLDDKALPLPTQVFQLSSAETAASATDLTYTLESLWAINKENFPKSGKEREGLIYILKNPGKNYYTTLKSKGVKYFMAVYPDYAISPACVQCHNSHEDSPKRDFHVGDLMGAVVLRFPLS